MGTQTAIEWTDHTFNPWIGCTKIAPGCTNCYAEALATRFGKAAWGPTGTRVKTGETTWRQPLKWNRDAIRHGRRARVFCASLADVFEDWKGPVHDHHGRRLARGAAWEADRDYIPTDLHIGRDLATLDDLRRDLFALIDATPALDWLLLTKRPERIRDCWPERLDVTYTPEAGRLNDWSLNRRENVWLGTSISDQPTLDANATALLRCRDLAPVLFISAEPLLAPINLLKVTTYAYGATSFERNILSGQEWQNFAGDGGGFAQQAAVDWVIAGGESGDHRRDHADLPDWIASIADQCTAADVPVFVKQDSHRLPGQRGRLCSALWNLKQFPQPAAVEAPA